VFPRSASFTEGRSANRLTLAKWLVTVRIRDRRVAVNRYWQMYSDRNCENRREFWFAGDPPSHPELLDWLLRVCPNGWMSGDAALIVTSATYRQIPRYTGTAGERSENRLLARDPFPSAGRDDSRRALYESGLLKRRWRPGRSLSA